MDQTTGIVSVPRAIARPMVSRNQSVIICNHEIATTLTNTFSYNYVVNPLSTVAKPWLAALSLNYSKFKFRKLVYHYNPLTSTGGDGSIVMALGFDMGDIFPQNTGGYTTVSATVSLADKDNLVSFHPSYTGPVWMPASLEVPKQRFKENRVTQSTPGSTTDDWSQGTSGAATSLAANNRNWFSDGYCVLAGNTSGSAPIGQLMVEYEIELYDPIVPAFN